MILMMEVDKLGEVKRTNEVNALWFRTTMNREASTWPRIQIKVLGYSLICSLVRSHHSLRSLPHPWASDLLDGYFVYVFFLFWPIVNRSFLLPTTHSLARERVNH